MFRTFLIKALFRDIFDFKVSVPKSSFETATLKPYKKQSILIQNALLKAYFIENKLTNLRPKLDFYAVFRLFSVAQSQ